MMLNPIKRYEANTQKDYNFMQTNQKDKEQIKKDNLKGLLRDKFIRNEKQEKNSWDEIDFNPPKGKFYSENMEVEPEKKELFNTKNALKPLLILTGVGLLGIIGISGALLKYSNTMAKAEDLIRPADIPRSMNILQEHQLALYRALRNPDAKNILGLIGVVIMSAFTLCAKNLVDGIKEVWIKKQEFDIEHDFQQDLIEVEKNSFAGKLDVVNTMYQNTASYFKSVFDNKKPEIFFKGKETNPQKENDDKKKNNKKLVMFSIFGLLGALGLSFALFKNYQKTVGNLETFLNKTTDSQIRADIQNAINIKDKKKAIETLSNIFKRANLNKEAMEENLQKVNGITEKEITKTIKKVEEARIYVVPPEALAGVSEKIQYYCFVDEERGHLYNWILNPENKFNKYLFLSFCTINSIGYLAKTFMDAIKKVAVKKENTKNELNLKKELVEIEINNFKAKKDAAIMPLVANFKNNLQKGKDETILKNEAENILTEIKTGPPYIYF